MKKNHLFVLAGLVWSGPGLGITIKGLMAYKDVLWEDVWWLLLITVVVCVGFYFIFNRVVISYSERILLLPDKVNAFMTFSPRGWMLLAFMMGLGITMKYIQNIPSQFIASFYCGLEPMLILSSLKFFRAGCSTS